MDIFGQMQPIFIFHLYNRSAMEMTSWVAFSWLSIWKKLQIILRSTFQVLGRQAAGGFLFRIDPFTLCGIYTLSLRWLLIGLLRSQGVSLHYVLPVIMVHKIILYHLDKMMLNSLWEILIVCNTLFEIEAQVAVDLIMMGKLYIRTVA